MKAGPALRVAAITTLLVACLYTVAATAIYFLASSHLTHSTDGRLRRVLAIARHSPDMATRGARVRMDAGDSDDRPVSFWIIANPAAGSRVVASQSAAAPALPGSVLASLPAPGSPATASLGGSGSYRLLTARSAGEEVVAGLSLAGDAHTENLLLDGELVAGPVLVLVMFGGSLAVGLRALAPVEQARRRQLEFTADASHELRTPLSVVRAEVDVALSSRRSADAYRDSLVRIRSESDRMPRLVDDLLWLARFDSQPPPPGHEPVDVATLAASCADRFRAVGPEVTADVGSDPALISAPPELIDRLMGVLLDNACRFAGPDGKVRIGVLAEGGRLALSVEDSGPGIPESQRARLFGRFQRAGADGDWGDGDGADGDGVYGDAADGDAADGGGAKGDGAGLGLAIGDAIVRSTGGRWRVADSPLGGALLEVSWRHPR